MRTLTQYLLPHKLISKIADLSANCKIKWVKNYLINYFIKRYPVNMQEAIEENPFAYPTYNHFFTRQLKPQCRPIDPAPLSIVSPADGLVAQIGALQAQNIIQAKGHNYSMYDLLGLEKDLADEFLNGSFATIYLAPKDYHRVHMPFAGSLERMLYIPGKLFSVNNHAAENIPNLFARNERVVAIFNTKIGKMAVVLVGAMIVGSISTVWSGTITPPHFKNLNSWDYTGLEQRIELDKGEELGHFKLGSTVIILFADNMLTWNKALGINMDIKMGQKIGESHA